MATRPGETAQQQQDATQTNQPSEYVRSVEEATQNYLAALMREQGNVVGAVPAEVAQLSQQTLGNRATAELLELTPEQIDAAETTVSEDDLVRDEVQDENEEEDEEELLPDPDQPAPADSAEDTAVEDESVQADNTLPPHEGAPEIRPSVMPGSASPPSGGGPVAVPSGGGGAAVLQAAQQTAANMPGVPAAQGPVQTSATRRRRRRPTRRQVAGPPPVPTVQPEFVVEPDPIEPHTNAIEEIAARRLQTLTMPEMPPSPGENTVRVPDRALTPEDFRMIRQGGEAMNRAGLSRAGGTKLPGERAAGETRERLLGIRRNLLGEEEAAEGEQAEAVQEGATPTEAVVPAEGAEQVDAEEAAPGVFTVERAIVPPAEITVAEQQMFTAAIASLKVDPEDTAEDMLKRIKGNESEPPLSEYPNNILNNGEYPALTGLGRGMLSELQDSMNSRIDGVAEILGTAGEVLDQAVIDRRAALEIEATAQTAAIQATTDQERDQIQRDAQTRLNAAATAQLEAANARHQAQSVGAAPELGFRETAEAVIQRIQTKVSEAIAGFQFEKSQTHKELDKAKARWISALELAVIADQFDAERAHGLEPGQTHSPDMSRADRSAISNTINAARRWKTEQTTFINNHVDGLKRAVDQTISTNIRDVQTAGADAFRAARDWGNTQDGAVEEWWQSKIEDLESWANNATDTANTWAQTESRLARMQMQQALREVREEIIEPQIAENEENNARYLELTEGQKRDFIAQNIMSSSQLLNLVGKPLSDSEFETHKQAVAQTVERELFALPRSNWQALNAAARAKNGIFNAEASADTILKAGYDDDLGTEEDEIFDALSGLRNIERLALTAAYNQFAFEDGRGENALYRDLDGELSGDEWRRAQHLMSGDQGAAAAEAIHDAVFGPGTSEDQIYKALEVLNRLPEGERDRALQRANAVYLQRYGETLNSRLREDLSGSEAGRAIALAAGDMREAEAHEMNYALADNDANAAAAVYERIRSEELARARRERWTPAEYEAAVAERNRELDAEFEEHYSDVTNYNWGNGSALENAVTYQFAFDEGNRHRLEAFQAGDLVGVSAGQMQGERRSFYADDEVMGNVVTAQYQRAADIVELERGPEMRANVQRQLALEVRRRQDAHDPMTQEEIENHRMSLEHTMNSQMANAAFDRARQNVTALDSRLTDRYGITLNDMITNTMSDNVFGDGGDLSNARARIEIMQRDAADRGEPDNRRLDWAYTRIRHSIEGAGTDLPELRDSMSGLTQNEIQTLNDRWKHDHDDETLADAIRSDTSGRDEDDLIDMYEHGMPLTIADQVDELRRRLRRDEESVGSWGAWISENHSSRSHQRLAQLEDMAERMRDPNLTPEERENLSSSYRDQRSFVEDAIQAQRDRVDTYSDMATTIIGYVVSAIVIAAAAIATAASGGTLSPALGAAIALSGSIVGTISGMAAKAAIKGGAYGLEEIGTDMAVGVVDLAVTLATFGMFKGGALFRNLGAMIAAAREEMRIITRQSMRYGFRTAAQQAAKASAAGAARATAREGAESGVRQRLLQAGRAYVREQAIDAATAIPTVLTANLLNEENWRHGNVAANLLRGTWEASLQNLRDGMIMGAAGNLANRGARSMIHPEPLTTRQVHDRNIRHWRHANPGASPADFARFVESYAAAHSDHADILRAAQREARRSLLSEIPPRERSAVADVPIIHVNDAQFRTYNNGNFGDAFVHVHDGQAVIIIRDSAPASAISKIGPSLRDIVAPGTRGRTINPAESLPRRLRNRVEVEVVNDSSFGVDEVRAVPQRDRDGNIIGVAMQVGPNARAIDIQLHVGTVDAMRRYAGLAGQVRQFINRMGRRLGIDIVDPSELGRWEASLEVAKLPAIIEERMMRLSEQGLDPRRRALVMEEIASLERQFMREVERADLGTAAEARGYVAAKPQADAEVVVQSSSDSEDTAAPMTEIDAKARSRDIVEQIRQQQTRLAELQQELYDAQGPDHSQAQNRIREQHESYASAMRKLKEHLPAELHSQIDYLDTHLPWPPRVAEYHHAIAVHPEFAAALAKLGKADQDTITRVGAYQETIAEFHRTRERIVEQQNQSEADIARLRAEYLEINGDTPMGVPLHPDLPEPRAPAEYMPHHAFEKKIRERLADSPELANELIRAIEERLDKGYSEAFDRLAERDDLPELLRNPERPTTPTLEERYQNILNHVQGYRAELSLASEIAGGVGDVKGLPGDGTDHVVIDYGDKIGENHADVISVDSQGNVFLWDSKYHSNGGGGGHSPTFTSDSTRTSAVADALNILKNGDLTNLPQAARDAAIANLEAGKFFAVTSHTDETLSNFRHFVQEFGAPEDGS